MAHGPARIESPEVIKELRNRFAILDQKCRNALMSVSGDIQEAREWLRNDRQMHWRRQLQKADEFLSNAKRELEQAKWNTSRGIRSDTVDLARAVEKAKRRREEIEQKIESVKRWSAILEMKITKMMGPCHALSILLDQRTAQAMARLDKMLDNLDAYFHKVPGESS
jgi:hypothetical protein